MSDKYELITIREAARRLGVSDTAVRKAYGPSGRIDPPLDEDNNPENGRPRLRWPLCRDQWNANTSANKRSHVGPRGGKQAAPPVELGLDADDDAAPGVKEFQEPQPHGGTLTRRQADLRDIQYDDHGDPVLPNNATLAEAQRIKAIIAARQGLLDLKRDRGEVVPVAQVERDGFKAGRVVRDAFLNIADRIAADLAAETDRARVHDILTREIRGVLQRLPSQ